MAVDIYSIDQLYPDFAEGETAQEKIQKITDYLFRLIESLRYTLYHLSGENFEDGTFDELMKKIEQDIGGEIDLSDYVKQEDLSDYVTDTELSTELAGYAKTTDLSGYATTGDLASYVPKTTASGSDNSMAAGATLNLSGTNVQMTGTYNADTQAQAINMTAIQVVGDPLSGTVNIVAPNGFYVNGTRIG